MQCLLHSASQRKYDSETKNKPQKLLHRIDNKKYSIKNHATKDMWIFIVINLTELLVNILKYFILGIHLEC